MCAFVTGHMTERIVTNHLPEVLSLGSLMQIEFHGVAYSVTTVVQEGENLTVEVEQQSVASRWRGQFTAQCTQHFCKANLTLCRCIECMYVAQFVLFCRHRGCQCQDRQLQEICCVCTDAGVSSTAGVRQRLR